jgi:hypothetical protein
MTIYYDSYSRALNHWRDYAAEFRKDFADEEGDVSSLYTVASIITDMLTRGLEKDTQDPMHPFRRYADADKTGLENFHTLATDVAEMVQDQRHRNVVVSFFHSSGLYYADAIDLLDEFLLFADRAEDEAWAASGEDAASESEDESESESEGEEESVGSSDSDDESEEDDDDYIIGPHDPNLPEDLNNF